MMPAAHRPGTTFLVPLRGQSPDVGFAPSPCVEFLSDEVSEIAAQVCKSFPSDPTKIFRALVVFGMLVAEMMQRRAAQDIDDSRTDTVATPGAAPRIVIDPTQQRRIIAAKLGRILDWICKGRPVLDMGVRAFAVASHVRAEAIDYRTNQDAADELGNSSRASVNRIVAQFRRELGADYPGENGKSSDTKRKCKTSRNGQLKN